MTSLFILFDCFCETTPRVLLVVIILYDVAHYPAITTFCIHWQAKLVASFSTTITNINITTSPTHSAC